MHVYPVCKLIAHGSVRNSFRQVTRVAVLIAMVALILPGSAETQVNVVTYHNDNARTGVNANETLLTPSNVNKNNFGKLFTQGVDGIVVGQPLYLSNVSIPGSGMHNVVYVATQHDSVYAFDADDNTGVNAQPLWQVSFINPAAGITTVPGTVQGCTGVTAFTELGIVSTPVIDPNTGTLYVIAKTDENGTFVHRLHALDVATGQEKFNGPVKLKATFRTNTGSVATFKDLYQMNRPGLLLVNGTVYAGFGSNGCNYGNQGWVLAYDALTLQQVGAFDTSPVKGLSSIWQSGAGLTADDSGNIYAETGEGPFDADMGGQDFGSSVLKLTQTPNGLPLTDYFTPYNQATLSQMDLDLSSAGVLVLPDQPGAHQHLAVATGKQGILYLLDCDNMGHYNPAGDTQIVQEVSPGAGGEVNGAPVYWNGKLYVFGGVSPIKAFSLNNGLFSTTPVVQSTTLIGGGHPATISANPGNTNGILWVINGTNMQAYGAGTLKLLYTTKDAGTRDTLPTTAHFATQTVANGKVYVATRQNLVVYGLFPALLTVAGNNQTAAVNTVLPVALKIKAVDPYSGQPFSGIAVTFTDGGKGGAFSTTTPVTDANGFASTIYTLPKIARTVTITAAVPGFAGAVLTETGTPAAPKWIVPLKGNNQSAPVTTQLPAALVVKVADQYSNGVPGITVNFNDGGAGGKLVPTSAVTDSLGRATTLYTTSTKAALVTINASALSLGILHMHETATAGPAANLAEVSGDGQAAPPSTQLAQNLVVHVSDQYGNAVPNASVVFSDGGAGGSFSAVPATSDTSGNVSVAYTTPPSSGVYHISASVSGVAATATFTATVP